MLSQPFHSKNCRTAFVMLMSCITFTMAIAQPVQREQKDDIDARRIGFITNEMELTPEEAQVFWPVYNKYRAEVETLKKSRATELMSAKINFDDYTDEEVNKAIENDFNSRQKELDILRRYNNEYKKLLPVKKVAKLYRAEQLFKISLLKEMRQEKAGERAVPPPKN